VALQVVDHLFKCRGGKQCLPILNKNTSLRPAHAMWSNLLSLVVSAQAFDIQGVVRDVTVARSGGAILLPKA